MLVFVRYIGFGYGPLSQVVAVPATTALPAPSSVSHQWVGQHCCQGEQSTSATRDGRTIVVLLNAG